MDDLDKRIVKKRKTETRKCDVCGHLCSVRLFNSHQEQCIKIHEARKLRLSRNIDSVEHVNVDTSNWEPIFDVEDTTIDAGLSSSPIQNTSAIADLKGFVDKEKRRGLYSLLRLLQFYEKGIPLSESGLNRNPKVISMALGGELKFPIDSESVHESVRACKKRFDRVITDNPDKIVSKKVLVGPLQLPKGHHLKVGYGESLVHYRPFVSTLETWLSDPRWSKLTFMATSPLALPEGLVARSYAESKHYRDIYSLLKNLNPGREFLLIPLVCWSDGAQFSAYRSQNSTAHPIIMSCPLMSSVASNSLGGSILIGFSECSEKISSSSSSTSASLRQQITARSLAAILGEMKTVQDNGGASISVFGRKQTIIPYLAYMVSDAVEAHKVNAVKGCAICFAPNAKCTQDDQWDPKFGNGIRFDDHEIKKIKKMERDQQRMREGKLNSLYLQKHRTYMKSFKKGGIKPILSFRELLQQDHIYGNSPTLPDFLHVVILGEGRDMIKRLYSKLDNKDRVSLEKILNNTPSFPKSLSNTNKSVMVIGAEVSPAIAMMPVILFQLYLSSVPDLPQIKENFEALALLIATTSKDEICDYDMLVIRDALHVLSSEDDERENTEIRHILTRHLFDATIMQNFGAPNRYSTGPFEAGLRHIKKGFTVSSNHNADWRINQLE
jgi:hypothetical protein